MIKQDSNPKRYYATIGGVKVEITKERADQIKRLQSLIRAQRSMDDNDCPSSKTPETLT